MQRFGKIPALSCRGSRRQQRRTLAHYEVAEYRNFGNRLRYQLGCESVA
jgi:hypothetical protein